MTKPNNAESNNGISKPGLTSSQERPTCDFCAELSGRGETSFTRLYAGLLESRIVARSRGFAALPTIGQIFPNSLLVLPEDHVETLASLPKQSRMDLAHFVADLCKDLGHARHIALFEHGARAHTGGSCGIYHAHLHVVPLPRSVRLDEMLPFHFIQVCDLVTALDKLQHSDQYLLFAISTECGFVDISNSNNNYPSQFFRRRLAELLMPDVPWDWRSVQAAEPGVIQTVQLFRKSNVS